MGKSSERKEQDEYVSGLKQLGSFTTVEQFLQLYAFIKKANVFPRDYSLSCFRTGCKPMWEEFPHGGCWNHRVRRSCEQTCQADRLWENTLLACIGEAFETPDVVGCVVSSRTMEIAVSVWNCDSQCRFKIGERLKEILNMNENTILEYKAHESSL